MSSLNLTPNPTVMAVEAVVFLVNFFAVKKLLLEPYLKVNAQRKEQTEGNQSQAEHLELENQKAIEKINVKIGQVSEESRTLREQTVQKAKLDRDSQVQGASDEASRTIESLRQELAKELAAERARIPGLVDQLTKEFVSKIVPA